MNTSKWIARGLVGIAALTSLGSFAGVEATEPVPMCGPIPNINMHYTDFRERHTSRLAKETMALVVGAHFNADVRARRRGQTATHYLPDLRYTLNHVPNFPDALLVAIAWEFDEKPVPDPAKGVVTAECYLERARGFAPTDPIVYSLSGYYYQKKKDYARAEAFYGQALAMSPDNPEIEYNLGLLAADQAKWPDAEAWAEKAYAKGFPLPGLRDRIQRAKSAQKTKE